MRYQVICQPYNNLAVSVGVDASSREQLSRAVNDIEPYQVPLMVIDFEESKVLRVIGPMGSYGISDDAGELIGPETPISEFKRITGEN